jgi:tetratricopeptide (TPR) repeat protein
VASLANQAARGQGDALAAQRRYPDAVDLYRRAWSLLPEPKEVWSAATWLLVAIADAQFLSLEFASAADTLESAKFCPGAIGNPFVHLRLGQSLLETGNRDRALDELTRAYMGGGREIFEEDDPKYLAALATVLKPPPGQDSL